MTRRSALGAAAVAAGFLLSACTADDDLPPSPKPKPTKWEQPEEATPPAEPPPTPDPPTAPTIARVPAPNGVITGLPGNQNLLAWTIDDGTDAAVVAAYAAFAASTGTRLTMFATGSYPAWAENADVLRPLVASGQIQIANHTWTHPDLTSLSDQGIRDELQFTHDRIGELFGVDARPFFRPPFGYYDDRVIAVAAELGYTTPTMWYGSLADSGYNPEEQIVALANTWFLPEHIVIGHLNFPPVTNVFPQLTQIIADRGLTTVTLNDVFSSPFHP